jgi:hypothetical protein
MAKQAGDIFIEGTIDDLTFYKMCGKYYVRMKTSLTGKRFWKDKAFEGSRKSCSRFGDGNQLASVVFKTVEKEKRTNRLFPFLRTRAIALLKEGRPAEKVVCLLLDYLVDFGFIEVERKQVSDGVAKRPEVLKKIGFLSSTFVLTQKWSKKSRTALTAPRARPASATAAVG